jgi:hypothetical protein
VDAGDNKSTIAFWKAWLTYLLRSNQDRAEIVDVGEGRAGDDLLASGGEEVVRVVAGERVGGDEGARDLGCAVDAVGVAGDGVDAGRAVKREGECVFGVRTADAIAGAQAGGDVAGEGGVGGGGAGPP